MTLGRVSMMSNGFSTPLPQAIEEENTHPSSESSLPTPQLLQTGFSLTSFFVEAIKLAELTSRLVGLLYRKPVQSGNDITESRTELKKDGTADLEDVISLETSWSRLYDNLPAKLCWVNKTATNSDLNNGETAETITISKSIERQRNVLHARYSSTVSLHPIRSICHFVSPSNIFPLSGFSTLKCSSIVPYSFSFVMRGFSGRRDSGLLK